MPVNEDGERIRRYSAEPVLASLSLFLVVRFCRSLPLYSCLFSVLFYSCLTLSLYAKVWFSFRVLANLAGKTHKSASNLVQIEQIPRYHPHTPKTPQSFIFEAIQTSASHGGNPESYLPCLKLLPRILETRFNFT